MARDLDVYLHGEPVGRLRQRDSGLVSFQYAAPWLRSPGAKALSLSLPLREGPFDDRGARPFFAGLLPEGPVRERLTRHLGLSRRSVFAVLEEVGGECAGAVSLVKPGTGMGPLDDGGSTLLEAEPLSDYLRGLPRRPLLAGGDLRLCLAGAHDKMALIYRKGQFSLPRGSAATTHILKTGIDGFDDSVVNEFFCLRLAARLGLEVPSVEIGRAGDVEFLLIERYDRRWISGGDKARVERLHQEDFCQALGVLPDQSLEAEGGPSLAQCFGVLASCRRPATARMSLMRRVVFSFLVGNAGAHGKNFAVLDRGAGRELAPVYDVLCTRAYADHSDRMAMEIGGEGRFNEVLGRHWRRLADEVGFTFPGVRRILRDLAGRLPGQARELAGELGDAGRRPVVARMLDVMESAAASLAG